MKIVIIEDEALLQEELTLQLNKLQQVDILQYLSSVADSIKWLKQHMHEVDLIFMDIELADGVSFDIFESLTISTPVIFLTAYSQYAIQAFKVNSIDYLLKPINPKELAFALNKFNTLKQQQRTLDATTFADYYKHAKIRKKRILVQSGDHFKYIDNTNIAYFLAEDKYTTVVTFDNTKHLIDESLNKLEHILPYEKFHRATRKHIVNIDAIVKASKYFNSRLKLELSPSPSDEVIISRPKVKEFLTWMGN